MIWYKVLMWLWAIGMFILCAGGVAFGIFYLIGYEGVWEARIKWWLCMGLVLSLSALAGYIGRVLFDDLRT